MDAQSVVAIARADLVVTVRAAGVNFVDGLMCQGRYQIKMNTPYVPGGEVAGDVSEIGDGVRTVGVGDRVMAMCGLGAFAEQVAVAEASVAPVPDRLGYGQAAAFVQSYSTVWYALTRRSSVALGRARSRARSRRRHRPRRC